MLAEVFSWWLARMREVLPSSLAGGQVAVPDGVIIEAAPQGDLRAFIRRRGCEHPLTLGAVPRLAGRRPVLLRAAPGTVLEKTHIMPAASRADMEQMLRLELGRITPFSAESVYWHWEGHPKPNDRGRSEVRLTIVPKISIASVLDALERIGIRPRLLEIDSAPARVLPLNDDGAARSRRRAIVQLLTWLNICLATTVIALPFAVLEWDLHRTQAAMDALRPTVNRVEELRRGIDASAAGQDILTQERSRNGDVPAVLAALTRVLPDNTYLTDLALRQRQLTIGGRSASAPSLITALAADPVFRNAAFAAPVTRIEGSAIDVFSIRAEVAP